MSLPPDHLWRCSQWREESRKSRQWGWYWQHHASSFCLPSPLPISYIHIPVSPLTVAEVAGVAVHACQSLLSQWLFSWWLLVILPIHPFLHLQWQQLLLLLMPAHQFSSYRCTHPPTHRAAHGDGSSSCSFARPPTHLPLHFQQLFILALPFSQSSCTTHTSFCLWQQLLLTSAHSPTDLDNLGLGWP